ncbi:MAG: N-acetylneuraminate synthase family protein [Saprospiraceae bacterium]|nr:N-acetylneuraminate synthase family protein [Saprospiraceae bacterium]
MKYNKAFNINKNKISLDSPTYFIADIAANHDNDIEKAKELIWLAAEAGADAAKFQHFTAKTIVSDYGFKSLGGKMSHQSNWEKSVYETYEDASLNIDWTDTLLQTCKEANIDFFTSPYSIPIVDTVDPYVPAYKVGSGDITYIEIIEHMAQKGKPVLLATGASNFSDVKRAVNSILKHTRDIALMQCNTNYTASVENFNYINLNVLNAYRKEFPDMILGLSDHTKGDTTVLAAIALGARVIEKHFTDDNNRKGPDHAFSMNPKSWRAMVDRSREVEMSMGTGIKIVEGNEQESVILQRRCIRLTKNLPANHIITEGDIESLRPAPLNSYLPFEKDEVLGKALKKAKDQGDAIFKGDI